MQFHQSHRLIILTLVLAAFPLSAHAHEFWIEPSRYIANIDQQIDVALRVGEQFKGKPVERKSDRIERFAALRLNDTSPQAETKIEGKDGDEPAGKFTPERPGLYAVIYDSNHSQIELAGEKFEGYLKEKGLDTIIERRRQRNESDRPAREIYSRCAKSLIVVTGDGGDKKPVRDRAVGMPLEIVAQFDARAEKQPRDGKFQILFDGKPLSGVQVTALSQSRKQATQKKRSNKDGKVTFELRDGGPWLVECTHMRPTPERDDADYESFWASLTFSFVREAKSDNLEQ